MWAAVALAALLSGLVGYRLGEAVCARRAVSEWRDVLERSGALPPSRGRGGRGA